MTAELLVHEVFEVFPPAISDEELDQQPRRTLPATARVHKPRRRQKSVATQSGVALPGFALGARTAGAVPAAEAPGQGAAGDPVPLQLFAQSRCCLVPAEVAARAAGLFTAPATELKLRSLPQRLSEDTPFVSADSISECLEAAASAGRATPACGAGDSDAVQLPAKLGWLRTVKVFAAAKLMGFEEVAAAARRQLRPQLGSKSLRGVTAAALAWEDGELMRMCYWALLEALCRPPPSSGPRRLGVFAEHFEYQQRRWPLEALAPVAEAAAQRRAVAQAAPVVDGFVVCRLRRMGFEAVLLRETASGTAAGLMRASLCGTTAVLYTDEGTSPSATPVVSGASRQYSEGCCGVVEAGLMGHRFELHEGVELLPSRDSEQVRQLRERFPYTRRQRLGVVAWDVDLLAAGRGQGHWRLNLQAPGLPSLAGLAPEGAGGSLELAPPGHERETPWLMLGSGTATAAAEGRTLCWRHPIGTALAFTVALAAVYPWDPGGPDRQDCDGS